MNVILTFARAYPGRTALTLAALLLASLFDGLGLTTLLSLLTSVAAGGDAGSLPEPGQTLYRYLQAVGIEPTTTLLLVVILASSVLRAAATLVANSQVGYTVAHVATDLRLTLVKSLLASRWEHYLHQPVGALSNAFSSECGRAAQAYLAAARMASFLMQALIYTVIAVLVSWQATLGALALGVLVVWMFGALVRMARRAGRKQTKLNRSLLSYLTDSLMSVKPLKAMGRDDLADRVLSEQTRKLNRAMRRQVISKEALSALHEPTMAILMTGALYVALVRLQMPLASVMVIVYLLARVLNYLSKVQRQFQDVATSESAYWSLRETIDAAQAAHEPPLGTRPVTLDEGIELRDLHFAYAAESVLDGVSVYIPAGALTTVIGPSGAGKTTLLDVVTALLRPQRGEVYIDGVPLAEIDRKTWRRAIGYVPQDTFLLHDSVLANVTLGDDSLTEADAERALRAAGAWDFVSALPQGVHTAVGERGGRFSGGQRQRIAIARALAHEPKLLILDEATSALDAESERAICETLARLSRSVTMLAISHRPALIEAADRVYRMQQGRAELQAPVAAAAAGER